MIRILLAGAAFVVASPLPATSASSQAGRGTVPPRGAPARPAPNAAAARIATAQPGQTIDLGDTVQGALNLRGKRFSQPVTIHGGRFTSIRLDQVSGVRLEGVTVEATTLPYQHSNLIHVSRSSDVAIVAPRLSGPGHQGRGIAISGVDGFEVSGGSFTKLLRGIVVNDSRRGVLSTNRIFDMTGDGINVADSHDVLIEKNDISDFKPLEGFHPDGIQLWSVKGKKPQSNITIRGNRVDCQCQGITQFDHKQGGSDNVVVTGNDVRSGYPHGIALYEARGATVSDNRISTIPGSRWRSRLNIFGGSVKDRGNQVGPKR